MEEAAFVVLDQNNMYVGGFNQAYAMAMENKRLLQEEFAAAAKPVESVDIAQRMKKSMQKDGEIYALNLQLAEIKKRLKELGVKPEGKVGEI